MTMVTAHDWVVAVSTLVGCTFSYGYGWWNGRRYGRARRVQRAPTVMEVPEWASRCEVRADFSNRPLEVGDLVVPIATIGQRCYDPWRVIEVRRTEIQVEGWSGVVAERGGRRERFEFGAVVPVRLVLV